MFVFDMANTYCLHLSRHDNKVVVAYDGVCTVFGVVFGGKPEVNGVGTGDKFTVFFGYYRHIEISLQNSPCGVGLGFEERHIDLDGVVDAIVLDEGGTDAGLVGIGLIGNAALVEGDGARPELDGERAEDYQQADGERHRP